MTQSDFFSRVYRVVRRIPPGRVTTYGAIARFLGSGQSARMVGWAMNKSYGQTPFVPAHRVVNRNGFLTGKQHFGFSGTMQQLLESEGVHIENDQIPEFENLFWDPLKYLNPDLF
ncbi:MAG: MGMT family protein [Chlorobi bacterium]|nr:MGMT family protein [Chlorobiota bacterium]